MKFPYLVTVLLFILYGCNSKELSEEPKIITVNGEQQADKMGISLIHEHVLVDFRGPENPEFGQWNQDAIIEKVLPYMLELVNRGATTFIECTPAYLGRDVKLLQKLSELSGLNILSNTGYYGAVGNKYLPQHAFTESADELAERWITEFEQGIEDTGIRPGFIKTSVNPNPQLSTIDEKLVRAACRTHLNTGLSIASHTGPAETAKAQLQILFEEGVDPSAFIWVHAQLEENFEYYKELAAKGVWISLDGIAWAMEEHVQRLVFAKENNLLNSILISQDAGWYSPEEPAGGDFMSYNSLFDQFIPALQSKGFTQEEIELLLVDNPARAFQVRIRKRTN